MGTLTTDAHTDDVTWHVAMWLASTPELLLDVTPSFGPEMSDGPGNNFESPRVSIANQFVFMQTCWDDFSTI